jgi:hypothetical protein
MFQMRRLLGLGGTAERRRVCDAENAVLFREAVYRGTRLQPGRGIA